MEEKTLYENEIGLVYDWGKDNVCISLVKKEQGELKVISQDSMKNPAFYNGDKPRIRGSILDNLKIQMCRKMMMDDRNVDFITITGIGPSDEKAWEHFYASSESVLDTLLSGKDAEIELKGVIASVSETYTQEDFTEVILPFYMQTENLINAMLDRKKISMDTISKVYVSGEYGNLLAVQKGLSDFTQKYF